ncbi:MAG: hypothetical protein GAK40_00523 [Burkholderia plantarii]|nr:MAG: hypothetical protein GAK40_00523 [Burkholderia plantarii]
MSEATSWHLHLQYTHEYWHTFCATVLGAPLHHFPGDGNALEAARYDADYARTLERYRHVFGEAPPAAIWPPPAAPAGQHDSGAATVSASGSGRPSSGDGGDSGNDGNRNDAGNGGNGENSDNGDTRPPKPESAWRAWLARALTVALTLGAAALASAAFGTTPNTLALPGHAFLALYLTLGLSALLLMVLMQQITYRRRPFGVDRDTLGTLRPDEAALLVGDVTRMAHVATLAMLEEGAITLDKVRQGGRDVDGVTARHRPESNPDSMAWRWLQSLPEHRAAHTTFRNRRLDQGTSMPRALFDKGWLWPIESMNATRRTARRIVVTLLALGIVKCFVGVVIGRPVLFLVAEIVLFALAYLLLGAMLVGFRASGPTRAARAEIERQRVSRHAAAQSTGQPADLLWVAALFSTASLADYGWHAQTQMMALPPFDPPSRKKWLSAMRLSAYDFSTGNLSGLGGGGSSDTGGGSRCATSTSNCSSASSCGSSGCGGCSSGGGGD